MGASWAQLLLLACIIALSTGQSCHDVTCCSGKVCVVESMGRSGRNRTRCVTPTTCDQLNCPTGSVCVQRGSGKAKCQVTCSNVYCTESFDCKEKSSSTECVRNPPVNCTGVQCPLGTSCHLLREGKKQYAVCLGESCNTVNCFAGTQCFNGTRTPSRGKKSISVETEDGRATVSLKTLQTKLARQSTKSPKGTPAFAEVDIAICLPVCSDINICPEGLVCQDQDHAITCRPPRSCEEIDCPSDQECLEVDCGQPRTIHYHSTRPRTTTMTMTGSGWTGFRPRPGTETGNGQTYTRQIGIRPNTKTTSHRQVLLQCVATEGSADNISATTEHIGGDVVGK